MDGLRGQRSFEQRDLLVGGTPVHRQRRHGPGAGSGQDDLRDRIERQVALATETLRASTSSRPGSSVVASSGRSASSGLRTLVVVRRGSSASRPHVSNTCAGRKTGARTSTWPSAARARPTARRRFWLGVSPRPAGAAGSTDGICSSPSSRSTSSTRSAGWRRSGRHVGGVTTSWPCPSGPTPTSTPHPIWVSRRAAVPVG